MQTALVIDSTRSQVGTNRVAGLSNLTLLMSWLLLTLSVGNLWLGTPRDYYEYLPWYENLTSYFDYTQSRFEPGFYFLAWVFRYIFETSFSFFIGCIAAVSLGIKFWLFKRYLHYPVIGILLYAAIFYPIHEYTQYRAALSIAFGFLAIHLMLEKRWVWAVLLFAVSVSLHGSSILLVAVGVGGYFFRGNKAALFVATATLLLSIFFGQLRNAIEEAFTAINPLTTSYLENRANIEDLSIFSVNNLFLIAMCFFAIILGYYQRSRYHMLFLTITLTSITPIILLPEAPIIAQRAKEVLFVAMVFLVCRSQFRLKDTPVVAFAAAQGFLLLYLRVREGIIFS